MTRTKTGRPSKCTPEIIRKIATLLANHQTIEVACAFVAIDPGTFYNWMAKGRTARTGIFLEFFNTISQATAQSQIGLITIIQAAGEKDWKAAAWILARRYPKAWGGAIDPENPNGSPTGTGMPEIHVHLSAPTEDPFHPAGEQDKAATELDEQWSAQWHARHGN